jgi:hypothetical protein
MISDTAVKALLGDGFTKISFTPASGPLRAMVRVLDQITGTVWTFSFVDLIAHEADAVHELHEVRENESGSTGLTTSACAAAGIFGTFESSDQEQQSARMCPLSSIMSARNLRLRYLDRQSSCSTNSKAMA